MACDACGVAGGGDGFGGGACEEVFGFFAGDLFVGGGRGTFEFSAGGGGVFCGARNGISGGGGGGGEVSSL